MNKLFRKFPFSHEDKIHEHIQESLSQGRRTKRNLSWCFHSFLYMFERGFLQKISYFEGKEWPIDDYAKDGGEELFTEMHCVL